MRVKYVMKCSRKVYGQRNEWKIALEGIRAYLHILKYFKSHVAVQRGIDGREKFRLRKNIKKGVWKNE